MARIRTVKPEYFTSTQVAECSPLARLLFIGMWCFCDDGGVHPADPMRLKMEVFPADPFTKDQMVEWIGELLSQGLLVEFESDGKRFWSVTGWHHQKIEKKTIKHPQRAVAEESSSSRRVVVEASPNGSREVAEASPPEGKGRDTDTEGNGKGREHPLDPPGGECGGEQDSGPDEESEPERETVVTLAMADVVMQWNSVPGIRTAKGLGASRKKHLGARLKEKYFAENWRDGISRIAKSDFCLGKGSSGWVADIDWFLKPDTLLKVLEGQYDNRQRGSPATAQKSLYGPSPGANIVKELPREQSTKTSTSGSGESDAGRDVSVDAGVDREAGP